MPIIWFSVPLVKSKNNPHTVSDSLAEFLDVKFYLDIFPKLWSLLVFPLIFNVEGNTWDSKPYFEGPYVSWLLHQFLQSEMSLVVVESLCRTKHRCFPSSLGCIIWILAAVQHSINLSDISSLTISRHSSFAVCFAGGRAALMHFTVGQLD